MICPPQVAADSACAAATLAYAEGIKRSPSVPNSAAMLAYIAETIKGITNESFRMNIY